MNLIAWHMERLGERSVLCPAFFNYGGETYHCKFYLNSSRDSIVIDVPELKRTFTSELCWLSAITREMYTIEFIDGYGEEKDAILIVKLLDSEEENDEV